MHVKYNLYNVALFLQETNTFKKLWKKLNKKLNQTSWEIAESRYMGLFQFVDMTKDFFFSYTYDLTYSLQRNYVRFVFPFFSSVSLSMHNIYIYIYIFPMW